MKQVKIGIPLISEAYKAKTPKNVKIVSESMVFLGAAISIVAGAISLPGWVIMISGLSGLTGRFLLKCIGEIEK